MSVSTVKIRVRYQETDQMGVVYYANYFVWFEIGRTQFFRELGFSYKELEKNGVLLPVIEAHCEYKLSAKYDDEVLIKTKITDLEGVKIGFEYEVIREKDKALLAIGKTLHAFVDKQGKPVMFKKKNPFIWNHLKESIN